MGASDEKLDEVFVHVISQLKPPDWALNHFNSNTTKIILIGGMGFLLGGADQESLKSKCAERKFKFELITMEKGFKSSVLELINIHGMQKFVTDADEWNQREISELFDENPNLCCKIWFVNNKGKLVSVRDREYEKNREDISQREKEEKVPNQLEIEQLEQNIDSLTKENETLKLENIKLENKLKDNFDKLKETEEKKNLENKELKNKLQENFRKLEEMEEKNNLENGELENKLKENFHKLKEMEKKKNLEIQELKKKFEENFLKLKEMEEKTNLENEALKNNLKNSLDKLKEEMEEKKNLENELEELKNKLNENIHKLKEMEEKKNEENENLKNKLKENLHQLKNEREETKNLRVALDSLTQERDKALKEAEELRTERDNIPNRFHQILTTEFTMQELEKATQNFSDKLKIGRGGFGCVYKGSLRRMDVAIKILDPNGTQGVSQFQQEVAILSQIRHPHLVTLIGSCSEESALVYEFLSNGSLESRLECSDNASPLTWQIRTRIIGEICLALIFLHSCKPHLVIHGDLNTNNILLDANLISKLGDFGISRFVKQSGPNGIAEHLTLHPAGTIGYCDPEYMRSGQLTPKSDVYSFGILILRLITRTNPLDIARRVREALKNGRFDSMVDESAGNWPFDQAKKLAEIAVNCAVMSRDSRPDLVTGVWSVIEPLMKDASLVVDENRVPHHFICPIFQDIMNDPHIAADGFTYEAEAIKQWINSGHNTSPMTNLVLPHLELIPNLVLRSAIKEWLENHPQQS